MELSKETELKLEILLQHFGEELIQALNANVDRYNLISSSDLKRSITKSIIRAQGGKLGARISFSVQGKFRDMNPRYSDKMPPVDQIMNWIETKGISKFRYVSGRKESTPVDDKAKRQIAWGIAMSRVKKGTFVKRKPWKNKTIGYAVNKLTDEILTQYIEVTGLAVKQNTF